MANFCNDVAGFHAKTVICSKVPTRRLLVRSESFSAAPRSAYRWIRFHKCSSFQSLGCLRSKAGFVRHSSQKLTVLKQSSSTACSAGEAVVPGSAAPVIVWFKHDLRLDDHPGLTLALKSGRPVVPLYCLDPQACAYWLQTQVGVEGLLAALRQLRCALRQRGSDLVVRAGQWRSVLPGLVGELGATEVIAEDEVEYSWLEGVRQVEQQLADGVQLTRWQLNIFDTMPYPQNYKTFASARGPALAPLEAVGKLPPLPAGIDPGELPSTRALQVQGLQVLNQALVAELADLASSLSSQDEEGNAESEAALQYLALGDSEEDLLGAVRAYVRYLDDGPQQQWSWLAEAIRSAEQPATPGGSFRDLFSQLLQLGVLSRRRVYHEAQSHLRQRGVGLPSGWLLDLPRLLRGGPDTLAAALTAAEANDYHWHLSAQDRGRLSQAGVEVRHWRWRGSLTDYLAAGPPHSAATANRPALLLVHGFGAFGEQWRGQLLPLAAAGYQVYAPTFPGYGRSEKPLARYGQDYWRDFLRDFVLGVVQRPVVAVGNSIGGFISASLAADYPQLVKGLVLLNSAGPIIAHYAPPSASVPAQPPPTLVVDAVSEGLYSYLQGSIAGQLSRLYPTNPARADEWLAEEIYRAACDPGAKGVFRSVFFLPKPRALNYLLDVFGGPVLVLQGELDPLNDAAGRAKQLAALCTNVTMQLIQGGHCPHDEVPEVVNEGILNFVGGRVLPELEPASAAVALP